VTAVSRPRQPPNLNMTFLDLSALRSRHPAKHASAVAGIAIPVLVATACGTDDSPLRGSTQTLPRSPGSDMCTASGSTPVTAPCTSPPTSVSSGSATTVPRADTRWGGSSGLRVGGEPHRPTARSPSGRARQGVNRPMPLSNDHPSCARRRSLGHGRQSQNPHRGRFHKPRLRFPPHQRPRSTCTPGGCWRSHEPASRR
jgi:hypothetical protein